MFKYTTVSASEEVSKDYLLYAVSTCNRAIPDIVDGLKVSQRRIIQSAFTLNLSANSPYRKVSKLAGQVAGDLHPHSSVGPTIIQMGNASDYIAPLIQPHGNLGGWSIASRQKISNDNPASERYVECRLSQFGEAVFDIETKFLPTTGNYDNSLKEIVQYTPALPVSLLNAQNGIGTGYATNSIGFPAHQIVNSLFVIEDQSKCISKLGTPDVAWATNIIKNDELVNLHTEGRASIGLIGEWEFGTEKRRETIIVTKLASGNVEQFISRLKKAIESEKVSGVANVIDETSQNIRIVIVLKSKANRELVLSELLKYTPLQDTYPAKLTFIHEGLPREFTPYQVLKIWYEKRSLVLLNKFSDQLKAAEATCEIYEGLLQAFPYIKDIVGIILDAESPEQAKSRIIEKYELSEIVTETVLSTPLRKLTKLNKNKLVEEVTKTKAEIEKLKLLVNCPEALKAELIRLASDCLKYCPERVSPVISMPDIIEIENETEPVARPKRARKLTKQQTIFEIAKKNTLLKYGPETKFPSFNRMKNSDEITLYRHLCLWSFIKNTKGYDKRKLSKMTLKEIKTILKKANIL